MNKTIWLTVQRCLADAEQERLASRAIVALSDDRQWLVVKPRVGSGFEANFAVYQIAPDAYRLEDYIPDTGQDAHDVLTQFLEGRDA